MEKVETNYEVKSDSKENIFKDLDGKTVKCMVVQHEGLQMLMAIIEATGEMFVLDMIFPKKKRGIKPIKKD